MIVIAYLLTVVGITLLSRDIPDPTGNEFFGVCCFVIALFFAERARPPS